MEEVQDAVLNTPLSCSELVDPVSKVVGSRSAKLVAFPGQQIKPCKALELCLLRETVEPDHQWGAAILLTEIGDHGPQDGSG
jgi:enoyl-CoA hydratase/carnithine racemase